jgi:hypothetical protein
MRDAMREASEIGRVEYVEPRYLSRKGRQSLDRMPPAGVNAGKAANDQIRSPP